MTGALSTPRLGSEMSGNHPFGLLFGGPRMPTLRTATVTLTGGGFGGSIDRWRDRFTPPVAMTATQFRTVLADDVFDLRFMVRLALERSGRFVVVAEAENGDEAVQMAEQHQPDLVLLDVSMPVRDGLEALPDILTASPHSKVVMLSGFEASRLAVTALEAGAAAYLEKGIPPAELVAVLLNILEGDPADNGRATA